MWQGVWTPCSCSPPMPSLPAPAQSPVYHFHLQMGCCWTYSDLGLTSHMAKQSLPMPAANQELVQCHGLTPEPYGSTWCLSNQVYHKPLSHHRYFEYHKIYQVVWTKWQDCLHHILAWLRSHALGPLAAFHVT